MEPSAKEKESKSSVVLTAILTAILTTIVSQVAIEVFSLNEPNLVHIGERPETPTLNVKFGDLYSGSTYTKVVGWEVRTLELDNYEFPER